MMLERSEHHFHKKYLDLCLDSNSRYLYFIRYFEQIDTSLNQVGITRERSRVSARCVKIAYVLKYRHDRI